MATIVCDAGSSGKTGTCGKTSTGGADERRIGLSSEGGKGGSSKEVRGMMSMVDAGKENSRFEGLGLGSTMSTAHVGVDCSSECLGETKSTRDAGAGDSSSEGLNKSMSAVLADAGVDSDSESLNARDDNTGALYADTMGSNSNSEDNGPRSSDSRRWESGGGGRACRGWSRFEGISVTNSGSGTMSVHEDSSEGARGSENRGGMIEGVASGTDSDLSSIAEGTGACWSSKAEDEYDEGAGTIGVDGEGVESSTKGVVVFTLETMGRSRLVLGGSKRGRLDNPEGENPS